MVYFKVLSIALGTMMVLGGLWTVLCRETAQRLVQRMYPEKKMDWVNLSSFAALALTIWTWYMFLTHLSRYSFVVTFVATLTFLKIMLVALVYGKYRMFIFGLFEEPVALRAMMLSSVAIGGALLFLGVYF